VLDGVGTTHEFQLVDVAGLAVPADSVTWFSLAPAVATIDPATGEVTAVSAGQAVIGARIDTTQAGYALVNVSAPGGPIQSWTVDTLATADTIRGIWGAGPDVIYAVGAGAAVRRTAGGWEPACPGNMGTSPSDVWGVSEHDVFIPQQTDLVVHVHQGWCGEAEISSRYFTLRTIWASGPDDAWVFGLWTYYTGLRTILFHWNGEDWRDASSAVTNNLALYDMWGADRNHIWAVGESFSQGIVRTFDGFGWRTQGVPAGAPLQGVWGASSRDVFAVGEGGRIVHFDGNAWTSMDTPTAADLYAVGGTAPTDVYAAGDGVILHYDGVAWSVVQGAPDGGYWSVWATSGPVYFGGEGRIVTAVR
jgi:hypothetical protein